MKRNWLLFCLVLVCIPQTALPFSETEIDSMESDGVKSFSPSPWRTQLGFSLQRNLEVQGRDFELRDFFDLNRDTSLLDLSNLYYSLYFNINYSLMNLIKNPRSRLKHTELFVSSSFNSPFSGHANTLKDYGPLDYLQYGIGDMVLGLTAPAFQRGNLLSYVTLSLVALPLSGFSREAGLATSANGSLSLLYFLKRNPDWNISLSSNHSLAYNYYTKDSADKKGYNYNRPFDTNQRLSLIYRQNYSSSLPSNTQISLAHYFGVNTIKSQFHIMRLGASSSWKLKPRLYLNASISWRDSIYIYNPENPNVGKKEPVLFNLAKTFISLGGSYSF